ncbi:NO-inducible flavohemoprotein [Rubritalea spongiae]|uniref:nitric oxide dioxygenase n=1 Tax=Rubritalea spongiae TaxID=430797 RepID=A0ABW5E593_9BACT
MSTLCEKTIETVKASVPFLSENALKLTCHFYQRMFKENPEVKVFFNPAHQVSGSQQAALAGAVCSFAENIETPEKLAAAVELIGNKHASLGVKAEHYPVVGKHLLGAIDDLLDPAPPEILEAWGEAYGFLADVLIGREKELYKEMAWEGFKEFEVAQIVEESEVIRSFYLKAADGAEAPASKPGQYVTLRLPDGNGSTTMRNYSLSSHGCSELLRISVKRESPQHADQPQGYASNYLHDSVKAGDRLELGAPCGEFYLDVEAHEKSGIPVLLLSGGVGVTPMLAMLQASAGRTFPVTFVQGAMNAAQHAFSEEVAKLADANANVIKHVRYSAPAEGDMPDSEGLFDEAFLSEFITTETEVYFCGPKPMMAHVLGALESMGHPQEKVHYEFFGPAEELKKCPMH